MAIETCAFQGTVGKVTYNIEESVMRNCGLMTVSGVSFTLTTPDNDYSSPKALADRLVLFNEFNQHLKDNYDKKIIMSDGRYNENTNDAAYIKITWRIWDFCKEMKWKVGGLSNNPVYGNSRTIAIFEAPWQILSDEEIKERFPNGI